VIICGRPGTDVTIPLPFLLTAIKILAKNG